MRASDHVGDDFGFRRIGNRGLENADDGGGARVQAYGLADYRGIALADSAPETIGEHGGTRGVGTVVAIVQQAPEDRVQAHDLEIRAADNPGAYLARLAQADHREADGREVAESIY